METLEKYIQSLLLVNATQIDMKRLRKQRGLLVQNTRLKPILIMLEKNFRYMPVLETQPQR